MTSIDDAHAGPHRNSTGRLLLGKLVETLPLGIGMRLQSMLPTPELTITTATPPEQVRERIVAVQESDRSRLGYRCSATESDFVAERAHAEIDRRLATRRGRKHGVTDKQMRVVATGVLLRTAGLVERSDATTSIVCALGIVGTMVWFVLMAFGAGDGLWELERMPGVDVDKLDLLSKTSALSAVVYAVVLTVIGVALPPVGARPSFRRRSGAVIANRVAVVITWCVGLVAMGLCLFLLGVGASFTLM